jgi:hypothetical protein
MAWLANGNAGLLPLALQGSGLYSPLAIVIIGGLISNAGTENAGSRCGRGGTLAFVMHQWSGD